MRYRLAVVAVGAVCGAAGCSKASAAADANQVQDKAPPVKVATAPMEMRKMPTFLTLTGSVVANAESAVAANVAGRITATYVERGQPVQKGQPMLVVDAKAAGLQVAQATAQSQSAGAEVALAKQDCARADMLFARGAIPKAEYERQSTECKAKLFNATAMRAQSDLATKLAGDTVIRAPIDGVVGERRVNVGEYVTTSTIVATVVTVDPVRIQVSVPEEDVALVKPGQVLNVHVATYPNRDFPATVRFVSPNLRANTRDLVVEAESPNADLALKPGMFATVQLQVGEDDMLTVPTDAIADAGTVKRMFLAKDGAAFEVVVRTGVTSAGRIAVSEALPPGTPVILKPPATLRDGVAIAQ